MPPKASSPPYYTPREKHHAPGKKSVKRFVKFSRSPSGL
jgi:hypothetical protein